MEHASWLAKSEKCCRVRERTKKTKKKTVDRNRLATVPRNRDSKAKKKMKKEPKKKPLKLHTRKGRTNLGSEIGSNLRCYVALSCSGALGRGMVGPNGGPKSTRSNCSLGPRLHSSLSARVAITTCAPCKHTYGILSKTSHMLSRCPQLTSRSCLPCQPPCSSLQLSLPR